MASFSACNQEATRSWSVPKSRTTVSMPGRVFWFYLLAAALPRRTSPDH